MTGTSVTPFARFVTVAEPGDPKSSTVTSALISRRGNCAALSALVLAVAEGVNGPMDAVVFPRHVVVRARGNDDRVFELLSRQSAMSMSQVRRRLGAEGARKTRVSARGFLAYYVDNSAGQLRFASSSAQRA